MSITGWGWKYDEMVDFVSIRKLIDEDSVDAIGPKQVTVEVDCPLADRTRPNSKGVAEEVFEGQSDVTVFDPVRGNAIELLGLDLKW
jgi:hypothetical protein